jgi:hypothetical protein
LKVENTLQLEPFSSAAAPSAVRRGQFLIAVRRAPYSLSRFSLPFAVNRLP